MRALRRSRCLALVLLAGPALGAVSSAARASTDAMEVALLEFLPANPVPAGPAETLRGILSVPPGWRPGDAAAVLLPDQPLPDAAGARILPALLDEGAAVLELDLHTPRGAAADNAFIPASYGGAELLPGLFGALLALRQQAGAGLVVAIGIGTGGDAAMLAADRHQAELHLGPDGPRFVAHAQLGPGRARFAAGLQAPEAHEGWAIRAELLCAALAWATAAARDADCRAALLRPAAGETHAVRHEARR